MRFVEAFRALGYVLDNHQNEWSAESDTGVCITLWKVELTRENLWPVYDLHLGNEERPNGHWTRSGGYNKRTKHLTKAVEKFGGRIDVVLLGGPAGGPYETAEPWDKGQRGFGWKITRLDRETGEFRVEVDQTRPFPDLA